MKTLFLSLLIAVTVSLQAQDQKVPIVRTGTSPAFVIFDRAGKLIKVYGAVEDCIEFCSTENNRKPIPGRVMPYYSNQEVNLHYQYVDTIWHPTNRDIMEDYNRPEFLKDKFLDQKTVFVVMQSSFNLVLKIYDTKERCQAYIDSRGDGIPRVIEATYYYRTKKSYDEMWRIREKRLGIKH